MNLRLRSRVAALALAALFPLACRTHDNGGVERTTGGAGLAFQRLWVLPLAETDSLYLGNPGQMALDPDDGSFYVADRFAGRVVQVDRHGTMLRTFGRKGRGPREFYGLQGMFNAGPLLVVDDAGQKMFKLIRRSTGEFTASQRYEGLFGTSAVEGDTAWLGIESVARNASLARWDLSSGRIDYLVPLPAAYRNSQPLASIYDGVLVAKWGDTLAVALSADDRLRLANSHGTLVDSVRVPVRLRLGAPDDLGQRLLRMQDWTLMASAASTLFNLARLPDGKLALVYYDQKVEGPQYSDNVYVTVLSPDRKRACVDGKLPVSKDSQPYTTFRGDTLFVLEQALVDDTRPKTTITAYRLDTSRCDWTAVHRV